MEILAIPMTSAPPSDPYAPWLNADDLALLHFHPESLPLVRATTAPTPTSTNKMVQPPPLKKSVSVGAAPDSAEDVRREKNRQKVRRHYYRKLSQLNALRAEVAQLEATFQRLATSKQNETSSAVAASQLVEDRIVQRVGVSPAALEQENQQLRRFLAVQHSQLAPLRQLFADEHHLFASTHLCKAQFIKPFTASECYAVRDKAVAEVEALGRATLRRGPGFAGWQDHVTVENGLFKFALQKTFRHSSPVAACAKSWPLVTDPAMLARLYSSAVEVKCVVVQQVDADNLVMFQEYRTMDTHNEYTLMKSLFLVSKVATATGAVILLRGLGEDRLADRERFLPADGSSRIVWHDVFSWTSYDRAGLLGEDCVVRFGGSAPTVGHNFPFWSIEVLHLVLRWESAVYGPPQLLAVDDGDVDVDMQPRTPPTEVL